MTTKSVNDGTYVWTYTYTIGHDLRGNVRTCSVNISGSPSPPPQPIDLPDEMKYDSHNRLTEYIATRSLESRPDKVDKIHIMQIGDAGVDFEIRILTLNEDPACLW